MTPGDEQGKNRNISWKQRKREQGSVCVSVRVRVRVSQVRCARGQARVSACRVCVRVRRA